jgi:hypothetical protein
MLEITFRSLKKFNRLIWINFFQLNLEETLFPCKYFQIQYCNIYIYIALNPLIQHKRFKRINVKSVLQPICA